MSIIMGISGEEKTDKIARLRQMHMAFGFGEVSAKLNLSAPACRLAGTGRRENISAKTDFTPSSFVLVLLKIL